MTTRHALLLSIVRMLLSSSANATIKSFAGLATLREGKGGGGVDERGLGIPGWDFKRQ